MTRKSYPTDLTDAQWQAIEPHFNQLRHYKWDKRQLVNAVLYMTKTGCQWRMLPNDFPPYSTVWSFYRRANQSGLWDRILLTLVQKNVCNLTNTSMGNIFNPYLFKQPALFPLQHRRKKAVCIMRCRVHTQKFAYVQINLLCHQ